MESLDTNYTLPPGAEAGTSKNQSLHPASQIMLNHSFTVGVLDEVPKLSHKCLQGRRGGGASAPEIVLVPGKRCCASPVEGVGESVDPSAVLPTPQKCNA